MQNEVELFLDKVVLNEEVRDLILGAKSVVFLHNEDELYKATIGDDLQREVSYEVDGKLVKEAVVIKAKNGIVVNYVEPYMRRRDPNSMIIGDDLPTDKPRFKDIFGYDFSVLRKETYDWLKKQDLAVFVFSVGQIDLGVYGIAIAPSNAGFFCFALGILQRIEDFRKFDTPKKPFIILYVAPPFRHKVFGGKQRVVHYRSKEVHEIFSYNLYPGPSAKKGVYSALIDLGEREGWLTLHASSTLLITPYGNRLTILHEGASGSGKSEMNENIHRQKDGSILFGQNIVTGDKFIISLPVNCKINPVSDDMTMCHPSLQKGDGSLVVADAENGWFIRVDHIKRYGTDQDIEALSIYPPKPLLFLNIDAQPNSTALLWEHIEDSPGVPCPNPRFVISRDLIPNIVKKPVSINVRSFGIRVPPCTSQEPTYGIIGIFHVLPPALAWVWRLVAPRGHANPSIISTGKALESEGVGSYWPFATGKMVKQANLLLRQIIDTHRVKYVLVPNQYIGAWKVGFNPQWIMREYVARRGGIRFSPSELSPARCQILGYTLEEMIFEGHDIFKGFLKVEYQEEVGEAAYDEGAKMLYNFFVENTMPFYKDPELDELGKKILSCLYDKGSVKDFEDILGIPSYYNMMEGE
jgi:hypothetical protein